MLMYEHFIDPDNIKKISLKALRFLGQELSIFLSFYEKDILLVTQDEINAFKQLKQITELINAGRFDVLINNPELMIDLDDYEEEITYLPSYYVY